MDQEVLFAKKQQIKYSNNQSLGMELPSQLVEGRKYKIKTLVEEMIIYSDNEAAFALLDFLGPNGRSQMENIQKLFGIYPPIFKISVVDYITVTCYSRLFRSLYNASFLNKKNSNYALELLSNAKFNSGIVKSIPAKIKVAHKYGMMANHKSGFQLHHYGIVFLDHKPYLLGVMSKGKRGPDLRAVLDEISSIVFEKMRDQKVKKEFFLAYDIN